MCDEITEKENAEFLRQDGNLNRRAFGKLTSIAAFSAMLPLSACAPSVEKDGLKEQMVDVRTPDGVSDSYFVHPASGKHPGILMWSDIKGLRPAFKAMGKRLAESGYAVLVVNPFYRDAKAPVAGDTPDFSDPDTRNLLRGMAGKLTEKASISDARAYLSFLDAQASVDTARKIGTAGYCMGGRLIMQTAAAVPSRVGAAASFHGGGLVTDKDNSPHLLIPDSPASVLHAIAESDDAKDPEAKVKLGAAYKAAGVPAEIEVYAGTKHGWCPPDSAVYDEAQAEKAWARMLALYKGALA
ncbi:MAG: dienelactone hydrolase family protein [Alphaproteobacteria bacterium]